MSKIQLYPGLDWGNIPQSQVVKVIEVEKLRNHVLAIHTDWANSDVDPTSKQAVLAVLDEVSSLLEVKSSSSEH